VIKNYVDVPDETIKRHAYRKDWGDYWSCFWSDPRDFVSDGAMGPFLKLLHPVLAGPGAGLVFLMAIIMGLLVGFIGGAIAAFIYNVAASHVGPIEVDLEVKA
jgi:hypothetical protein